MELARFLVAHDGVISRSQAHRLGLSDSRIARLVRRGEWRRIAPSVYLAVAWPFTVGARVRAAAAWGGDRAALAGVTAAWWWGLPVDGPRPVTVALPRGASRAAPPGVTILQRDPRDHRERHRGLWVIRRPLAVLDAAVALGPDRGQRLLDRALQTRVVRLEDLAHAQARHHGRRGSPAAGRLVARAADRAASEAERRTVALLRDAGLVGWSVNLRVVLHDGREMVLDLAFPAARLVVEVDGWAHHQDVDRFVGDRARKRALVAEGWTVVEVTWWELENTPDAVLDQLRRTLDRLAA